MYKPCFIPVPFIFQIQQTQVLRFISLNSKIYRKSLLLSKHLHVDVIKYGPIKYVFDNLQMINTDMTFMFLV